MQEENDFLAGAPRFLINRFNSIHRYVKELILPEEEMKVRLSRIKLKSSRQVELKRLRAIINEASILAFIFIINKFFKSGSDAAKDAVDTLKELNVDGFYVGSNFFSERNEKVIQGDRLSQALLATIKDESAKSLLLEAQSITDIAYKYKDLIYR